MQYLGGKARCGKQIAEFLHSARKSNQLYVEPFVGSAWVLTRMAGERLASDSCLDLILLWEVLQRGWEPPTNLSEDEYQALKTSSVPSALRAFAGFGCSFAGKWFGGYARNAIKHNYALSARNLPAEEGSVFERCPIRLRRLPQSITATVANLL